MPKKEKKPRNKDAEDRDAARSRAGMRKTRQRKGGRGADRDEDILTSKEHQALVAEGEISSLGNPYFVSQFSVTFCGSTHAACCRCLRFEEDL